MGINKLIITSLTAGVILVGCGGGGGSSFEKVSFKNAKEAEATLKNGEGVTDSIMANIAGGASVNNIAPMNKQSKLEKRTKQLVYDIAKKAKHINETEECDNEGTVNYEGDVDNSGGTVTIKFNNCEKRGAVINGKVKAEVEVENDEPTYIKLYFLTDLTAKDTESEYRSVKYFKGSVVTIKNIEDESFDEEATSKIAITNSENKSKIFGEEDAKYHVEADYTSAKIEQKSGKLYFDDASKYVIFNHSNEPFVINSDKELTGGSAVYDAKGGDKILIEVKEPNKVRTAIDKNGDGEYEEEKFYDIN